MTGFRIIDWLGRLSGSNLPVELRSERVMRLDSVLRASIILNTRACALVRLYDIEGRSVDNLQSMTGMSRQNIQQNVVQTRIRLTRMLNPGSSNDEAILPEDRIS